MDLSTGYPISIVDIEGVSGPNIRSLKVFVRLDNSSRDTKDAFGSLGLPWLAWGRNFWPVWLPGLTRVVAWHDS
jgi:hypothetical protein